MNTNGRTRSEQPGVANSVSELAHNAIELAELQSKLFSLDMQEMSRKAVIWFGLVIASVGVLLGSISELLITLAQTLVESLHWSPALSDAVAALAGLLVSALMAGIAWMQFRSGMETMKRSREELNRNVAWLKSNLRNRGQNTPPAPE